MIRLFITLALLAVAGLAQKEIPSQRAAPGSTQDFSAAGKTRPMKVGPTPPAICAIGDQFYKTGVTAGQNLYGCTAANTWTLQAGGGVGAITSLTGDGTASGPGAAALTLANSGVSAGSCGDTTHSCGLTIDAKGRITVRANNVIAGGSSSVSLPLDFVGQSSGSDTIFTPNGIKGVFWATSAGAVVLRYTFMVPSTWTGTLADITLHVAADNAGVKGTYRLTVETSCSGLANSPVWNTASNFNMTDDAMDNAAVKITVTSVPITNCVLGGLMALRITDPGKTAAVYTSTADHTMFAGEMLWH